MEVGARPTSVEDMAALIDELFPDRVFSSETAVDELVLHVPAEDLLNVCRLLRDDPRGRFDYLRNLSGVDWGDQLGVTYHLWSIEHCHKLALKVLVPYAAAAVDSVYSVWRAADWHEREAAEMFGIAFRGHPHLIPLLLEDGFVGHPMRKSYSLDPELSMPHGARDSDPMLAKQSAREERKGRARAEGEGGGEERPRRARAEGEAAEERPRRPRAEGDGVEDRPRRPRADGEATEERPGTTVRNEE